MTATKPWNSTNCFGCKAVTFAPIAKLTWIINPVMSCANKTNYLNVIPTINTLKQCIGKGQIMYAFKRRFM